MELRGQSVGVIGLGESGLAMAKWLHRQGARVTVLDTREAPPNQEALHRAAPEVVLHTGKSDAGVLADCSLIAISPGISCDESFLRNVSVPLVSEVELFTWGLRTLARTGRPPGKVLAITGSNGKTTTTALTAHLLNEVGIKAVACGNISPSLLDALMTALDEETLPAVWVLELSSFQLETTHSLNAEAATVLNLSADHLDRHGDIAVYADIKRRIFQGQAMRILNRDDDYSLSMGQCGAGMITFGLNAPSRPRDYGIRENAVWRGQQRLLALNDLPLNGLHNAANLMAALALCQTIGVDAERVLPGLATFRGLPHRVEIVCEHRGRLYVDDSKGTNVGATLAAIEGMGRKLAIILGGDGKGQDFSPLKTALAQHARAIALMGKDAPLIAAAIEGCGIPTRHVPDMASAVLWLTEESLSGDAVLLSPACASLDMYQDYAHRAAAFRQAVASLCQQTKAGEGQA